jgi:hypothetical protein
MKRFESKSFVLGGLFALCLAAAPATGQAADHGAMGGMQHGAAPAAGHDMTKMGDKAYEGKLGPWKAEARIMDMKAHMAAMPSGMKMEGPMPNSHHLAVTVTDPKTKKAVTEGKGTVTVTGPDGKAVKSEFMVMQGHFGADVNLPAKGKYAFAVEIESGGAKGSAKFGRKVK